MLINIKETALVVLNRLRASTKVVYDAETSGLDWRHNHIVGHVLTFGPGPQDTFYIPVRHAPGNNLHGDIQIPVTDNGWKGDVHWFEVEMIKALEGKLMVFHNGAFDMRFLHRIGWRPSGPMRDTMIAAYLTNELRRSFSLDACCKDERVQAKKGDDLYAYLGEKFGCAADRSSMAFYWRTDPADYPVWDYAVGDGTSTWQLDDVLVKAIDTPYYITDKREYTLTKVADVEFKIMPILHRMSMRGVKIDEEYFQALKQRTKSDYDAAVAKLGGINTRSSKDMEQYFRKHGITDWPLTETGRPSFAGPWLATTEPGKVIVTTKKYGTLLSNFLVPMFDKYLYNGRVHPQIHQTRDEEYGTKTGRMSVTDPNLSAIPGKRQGGLGKTFRQGFIADDGMEFGEFDYSTCEIRICAHYCGAKLWVDGFNNGIDAHTSIADGLTIPRRHAKTINLAIMTGAGKGKIASELGLSEAEGMKVVNDYFDGLPELKEFQKTSTRIFKNRGFMSTLLGRRLQLADPQKAYTALNRLTQGGNADMTKASLIAMDPIVDLKMPVHDSNLVQFPRGDDKTMVRAAQAMVDVCADLGLKVPMEAEMGRGLNWGEATFSEVGKVIWRPTN